MVLLPIMLVLMAKMQSLYRKEDLELSHNMKRSAPVWSMLSLDGREDEHIKPYTLNIKI